MADEPEAPGQEGDHQDRSTSSSKLGDLPGSESKRDCVPELPNIGRGSIGARSSLDRGGPGTPQANGDAGPPHLAKVHFHQGVEVLWMLVVALTH